MIDSLNTTSYQALSSGVSSSPYNYFLEKFSALLATAVKDTAPIEKKELSAPIANETTPSAYVQTSTPWSMEKNGSHIVDGVQLVPGAPGYNAGLATPYHQEIAYSDVTRATGNTSTQASLASLLQSIETPVANKVNTSQIENTTTSNNPPSAYIQTSTPWSMEKNGSHIVDGVQLIPGAPGYNAALAAPYHQEIAQTNARF